jgi:FkbM family methyltransferase
MIKAGLRRLIESLGYELRRKHVPYTNCWSDVARLLKAVEAPIIVDVGANIGQSCTEMLHVLPLASVHCIEPDPDSYSKLCSNVGAFTGVKTWQLAMGSGEGLVALNRNVSPDTNSFLKPSAFIQQENWRKLMSPESEMDVRMTTLESWAANHRLEKIHLLKTDCQGYDLNVLKGAEALLRCGKIDLLVCEVLLTPLYDQQAWFEDILGFTRNLGYRLHGLYDLNRDSRGDIAWADALFVHESIRLT